MRFRSRVLTAAMLSLLIPLPTDAVEFPRATLVGSYGDWFVFRADTVDGATCYAMSQPKESQPSDVQRGDIFFMVSAWSGMDGNVEPSIVPGYRYGNGLPAGLEIGEQRFTFAVIRNEGDEGGAWMQDADQERRLIAAMKRGSSMLVTGTSERGTVTRDTYTMAGVKAAFERVELGCDMDHVARLSF